MFMEQMYAKITRPIKLDSTEMLISPLEKKTIIEGISKNDQTRLVGNYDPAPRLYGILFSPIE